MMYFILVSSTTNVIYVTAVHWQWVHSIRDQEEKPSESISYPSRAPPDQLLSLLLRSHNLLHHPHSLPLEGLPEGITNLLTIWCLHPGGVQHALQHELCRNATGKAHETRHGRISLRQCAPVSFEG